MKKFVAILAVLVSTGLASAQDYGPQRHESFRNLQIEDKTWCFGLFGQKIWVGNAATDKEEASRELTSYATKIRLWNMETVSSIWWKGWRSGKVAQQYINAAALADAAIEEWRYAGKEQHDYAVKVAVSYRRIADLITASTNLNQVSTTEEIMGILDGLATAETKAIADKSKPYNEKDAFTALCKK